MKEKTQTKIDWERLYYSILAAGITIVITGSAAVGSFFIFFSSKAYNFIGAVALSGLVAGITLYVTLKGCTNVFLKENAQHRNHKA